MGRAVHRLVLSGYYGFKNSGDEAVLQSILLALEEEGARQGVTIEPIVLSIDPAWTERMYGVRAAHRMKPLDVLKALRGSSGLISGGGSLLQDTTSSKTIPYYLGVIKLAQWLGKPAFVYSQGIGPVGQRRFFSWIRRTFAQCRYVSVRDAESAALLRHMGYTGDAEVVPDPVMGLPLRGGRSITGAAGAEGAAPLAKPPAAPGGAPAARPVVGVSVRFWSADRADLEALAQSLRLLRERRDVQLRFLPFHLPADEEASREVIRRMGAAESDEIRVIPDLVHPQDMLAEVSGCDLLIGMRLHSLIYAASQYVPMSGISYDPKIDQFLGRLQMEAAASVSDFDAEQVAAEALHLLDARPEWMAAKRSLIDSLKAEAHHPARAIVSFLLNER